LRYRGVKIAAEAASAKKKKKKKKQDASIKNPDAFGGDLH
jgi:hypothetical protein